MGEKQIDCADILKVLADETRLGVVRLLLCNSLSVSEIKESLQVEQTLLSHHLRVLREKGVILGRREGKSIRYSLTDEVASRKRNSALDLGCCQIVFEASSKK